MAVNRISPFNWENDIALMTDLKHSEIFPSLKSREIVNGITFVLHDGLCNLSLLTILIKRDFRADLEKIIISNSGGLQMLLIETTERIKSLINPERANMGLVAENNSKLHFTAREEEVLYWAGMGKTYAEISIIIGITVRTVKFHMGNIVEKLGVKNSRQAICLSAELQLIKFNKIN